ncbi:antiviral reverse transcriptase Drt3a [Pectobacterium aroidearum]|uniref:antiviral reverse transcriptase Drt3a n=1 Tax=Pectobacterium aroidearum TaxID=1201031 RepID=UPI00211581B1|nr:antiviral reverse transcriptase Drt3a [Pectobacterium aroidearum]UUE46229.1 RNA-directed DNA polymerase [Pectobacterium aroidearum]UUE50450.1 RNA-directed DNA polymerase [Pectobacterium aroidearum]UUE54655.1 RNA-directed DNA polymerase [Pectobacterium aroidearum]UUE63063.1 RNA-directed DNA polymerase [Pectobacterium aroidearum]UUE67287.1 RNA-directed DNA polymerase [Pectobacterium aroidearum]
MLDQKFTGKSLLRLTSLKDIIRFNLGRNRDEYLEKLEFIANKIANEECNFSDITFYEKNRKKIFKPSSLESIYSLRRVNNILGRIYKVKQSDRDTITKQINSLISDTSYYVIIKGDIKDFYESIPRDSLISKIEANRILSYHNRGIVKNIFSCSSICTVTGLPRGISISSSLSELYIRDFDKYVRSLDGVYYYARYVDDFIIFCHKKSDDIFKNIEGKLKQLGLTLNYKKTKKIRSEKLLNGNENLVFLGYEHFLSPELSIKTRISKNRIKKIKTRIVLSFLDYAKNHDVNLLCLRLKFITGNYLIQEPSKNNKDSRGLMAGFYYNNKTLTDISQVLELDRFLMKLCRSKKGSIYRAIGAKGMRFACIATQRISFDRGFNQRKIYDIAKSEFSRIKNCWKKEEYYEKK